MSENKSASVRARLKNKAEELNIDFQRILNRYALERFLYRLSISDYRDDFLLKGALLFDLWFDMPFRPTRDIDLLGFGLVESAHLGSAVENICRLDVDDGVDYDEKSIQVDEIRKQANYSGLRVNFYAYIDKAKIPMQIDVGYGDAVVPSPELASYPAILKDMPTAQLRVYPYYAVISEKVEAILTLGLANTRMKDYFDLWVLLKERSIDHLILKKSFGATLQRRKTILTDGQPEGLSAIFSGDQNKNKQWQAFLNKNNLEHIDLNDVVEFIWLKLNFLFPKMR